jgi:Tol biopolymer transport system component
LVTTDSHGQSDWYRLERPRFSPDGQKIAYDVYGSQHTIWISPVAGGRPVRLDSETTDQHGPSWSPDGTWIAYRRERLGKWELVKAPFGGGAPVVLSDNAASGGVAGSDTVWTPDGNWICFRNAGGRLYLASADGKQTRELTRSQVALLGFSKDGTTLYAVRTLPNRTRCLVLIDVASGKERSAAQLAIPIGATIAGVSLHPDGTRFAVALGVPKSDIWLLEGFRKPARSRWGFSRP